MVDKAHADFPYAKATVIYVAALSLLAVAVFLGFLLVREQHAHTARDAGIVNAAGRQRMLAQQMARKALALDAAADPAERDRWSRSLLETFDAWRSGHDRIVRADVNSRVGLLRVPANQQRFATVENAFLGVGAAIRTVLTSTSSRHDLGQLCDDYVAEMDGLLLAVERDSESRSRSVSFSLRAIVGVALVLIAIEGIFVFRPLLLRLQSSYGRLREAHEHVQRELAARVQAERERDVLKGLLPICSGCKKIRDDAGTWRHLEAYIEKRSEARFTHGLCQDCLRRLYPDHADAILAKLEWGDKAGNGAA
ncbi:MAG: type IV pili methyl-accepting chemotaxis transducer N-terminal domain-containing protein [Polyangiaceae bacterium]|jgi:nitrate/nitrite-specific signal transduction histidine kinase|nr:type IV pili methyl-accepting chemotaxis transducer N-terminal domain-containing protein [Polyangiaceae bacterium]